MGKTGFNKKTIRDISLEGKRVLMRADYNVPVKDGHIEDDYRLRQSLPSIEYILGKGASLVIVSHLGRPASAMDKQYSLAPVAHKLSQLLDKKVSFAVDCVGKEVKDAASKLLPGQVLLLENLRFHDGEEKDDPEFAKALVDASGADFFVQDGFGVVHRAHASTEAITKLLPAVAGLLLEKEVVTINQVMSEPAHPLTAVIGGAKISDKIDVIEKFMDLADCVALGGALANDFLRVEGVHIGKSVVEPDAYELAEQILQKARRVEREREFKFLVPVDGVVSTELDGRVPTRVVDFGWHSLADAQAYPRRPKYKAHAVAADEMVLDIGPISAGLIAGAVGVSKTVVWAGTLGVTETSGIAGAAAPFAHGSYQIAQAMMGASNHHKNKAFSLVGGGDTVSYIESHKWTADFSHVSTGGSASLELMAGKKLPGVESLQDR